MAGSPRTHTTPPADSTATETESPPDTTTSETESKAAPETPAEALEAIAPPQPVYTEGVPAPGTKCVKFDPLHNSSYVITSTQFKEAAVSDGGFAAPGEDDNQVTEASFNKLNGHLVPVDVFSKAGLARLIKEADLSLFTVPDPEADDPEPETK